MNIAILAIDPGESTGVAWAIVNPHARLASDSLKQAMRKGSATVTGAPLEQAYSLWSYWQGWKNQCVYNSLLPPENVHLVMEDFRLVPNATPGKRTTAPERVAYAFLGYRLGRHDTYRRTKHYTKTEWQDPSAAARYATRKMLEPVDCWVRGRQHERSAWAHMYLYIARLLDSRIYRA